MAAKKAVTKKEEQAVAPQTGQVIPGLEGVTQDLLIIPRLKLVQKNSVEVDDLDYRPGSIVNSVTKDIICEKDQSIEIFPLVNKANRVYFRKFDDGGGIICQSADGKIGEGDPGGVCKSCPHSKFTKDEENPKKSVAPRCTDFINVFCHVRGYDFPIPLTASFGRTSKKTGQQLVNYFWADAMKNQISPWCFSYQLSADLRENDFGKFYVFKVTPSGKAVKAEIEKGLGFYNLIKNVALEIHADEDELMQEQENMSNDSAPDDDDEMPFK